MKVQITPEQSRQDYHTIPELLIYGQDYGKKRVMFQMALHNCISQWDDSRGPILYNPLMLLRLMNFKANYNNDGIIKQLNDFVNVIESKNYVKLLDCGVNKSLKLYMLTDGEKNALFHPASSYGIIYNFEFLHLLRLQKNKKMPNNVKIWNLLLVLAYIRQHIISRPAEDYNSKKNRKKRPETYVTTEYIMAEELGMHKTTVTKCVKALDEIGIIYHENLVRVIPDSDVILNGRTIFANKYKYNGSQGYRFDSTYDYKKEVKEIKLQLKPYGEYGRTTSSDLENLD